MKKEKKQSHWFRNTFIGIVMLGLVAFILTVAPDYTRDDITDRTNLIINKNIFHE